MQMQMQSPVFIFYFKRWQEGFFVAGVGVLQGCFFV